MYSYVLYISNIKQLCNYMALYVTFSIEFTNTTEHTNYFNESSTELITVRVLAEDIKTTCQFFEVHIKM